MRYLSLLRSQLPSNLKHDRILNRAWHAFRAMPFSAAEPIQARVADLTCLKMVQVFVVHIDAVDDDHR